MENNNINQIEKQTPPYTSFVTFQNALNSLTEHGVPGQIDSTVLSKFSGSVQRQIIPALKFMGMIDDNNQPTLVLEQLANTDQAGQKLILKKLIEERYPNQIPILPNGTLQQIRDSFNNINLGQSVKSKCITFFLKSAEYSGFEISHHISTGMRKRGPTKKIDKKRTVKKKSQQTNIDEYFNKYQYDSELKQIPIPLGVDKIWYVAVDENYSEDEIDKFTQMIKLVLG